MDLNQQQKAAIHYIDGPLLVLAGAGSGKTRVITEKIAYLIQSGAFAPQHIIAVTFTNKAAQEMSSRVATQLSGKLPRGLMISTFHSLGLHILRHTHTALSLGKHFSILDQDDTKSLLQQILQNEAIDTQSPLDQLQQQIAHLKNTLVDPNDVNAHITQHHDSHLAKLYINYERYLRAYNAVDFDDLIYLPARLFTQQPDLLTKWQQNIRYVLVDEYQDTNHAQYQLLKLLVGTREAFTVVGDDDQAIYAWRGAQAENLVHLKTDFPRLNIIKLERNYRSSQRILRCANQLIANNPHIFDKALYSHLGEGDKLKVRVTQSGEDEAQYVAQIIRQQRLKTQMPYQNFAILYRGNHQAKAFEQALRDYQIPYRISGGTSFFARTEIKDIMAYFRLFANPEDDSAFLRIINTPRRGIGPSTLEKLTNYAKTRNIRLLIACHEVGLATSLQGQALQRLRQLADWITKTSDQIMRNDAIDVLKNAIETIDYSAWLHDQFDNPKTVANRLQNIETLLEWIAKGINSTPQQTFSDVIAKLCLQEILQQQNEDQDLDEVQLSTLHAAKGLEFKHVFLVGMEESLLPHQNSIEENRIEEERRLTYVGITRAMETLTFTLAKMRKRYQEMYRTTPSRFLSELPNALIEWEGKMLDENYTLQENQQLGEEKLAHLHELLGIHRAD